MTGSRPGPPDDVIGDAPTDARGSESTGWWSPGRWSPGRRSPGRWPPGQWAQWSAGRRRTAAAAGLLVTAAALGLGAGAVEDWRQERALRDVLAVEAELGVDASSSAWSPSGRGRVEYSLVLRNRAPHPTRVTAVRFTRPGLTVTARSLEARTVLPGELAYLPLSVRLDCRRWRPDGRGAPLAGSVALTAASGRSADVPAVVDGAGPLLGVVRTLCGLDPDLRVPELSGPVPAV